MRARLFWLLLAILFIAAPALAQQPSTISNMPSASTPLSGSELLNVIQSGISKKTSIGQIQSTFGGIIIGSPITGICTNGYLIYNSSGLIACTPNMSGGISVGSPVTGSCANGSLISNSSGTIVCVPNTSGGIVIGSSISGTCANGSLISNSSGTVVCVPNTSGGITIGSTITGSCTNGYLLSNSSGTVVCTPTNSGVTIGSSITGSCTNGYLLSNSFATVVCIPNTGGSITIGFTIAGSCTSGFNLYDNGGVIGCQANGGVIIGATITGSCTTGFNLYNNAGAIGCQANGAGSGGVTIGAAVTGSCTTGFNLYNNAGVIACQANGSGGGGVTIGATITGSCTTGFNLYDNGGVIGCQANGGVTIGATITGSCTTGFNLYDNGGVIGCQANGGVTIGATITGSCTTGFNLYDNGGVIGCQANGAGSGTVTSVTITAGSNVTTSGTCNSTTSISCTVNASSGSTGGSLNVRAVTSTTDTILSTDINKLVTYSNASPVAVTLPQATGSFTTPFCFAPENIGVGLTTITPTTSTINGVASLVLAMNQGANICSDGTNWQIGYSGLAITGRYPGFLPVTDPAVGMVAGNTDNAPQIAALMAAISPGGSPSTDWTGGGNVIFPTVFGQGVTTYYFKNPLKLSRGGTYQCGISSSVGNFTNLVFDPGIDGVVLDSNLTSVDGGLSNGADISGCGIVSLGTGTAKSYNGSNTFTNVSMLGIGTIPAQLWTPGDGILSTIIFPEVPSYTAFIGGSSYTASISGTTLTLSGVTPGTTLPAVGQPVSGAITGAPNGLISGIISTLGAITGGTGGTNGVYGNVHLTGGRGGGAVADVTVSGNVVTAVSVTPIARTISGLTGLSRSASTTAVLLCTTCNAAAGDLIVVTNATPATYNGTWQVTAGVLNTSVSFTTATLATDTGSGESVSAISGSSPGIGYLGNNVLTASFTGSPSGWSILVSTVQSGSIAVGTLITSGSGLTWTINKSQTVPTMPMWDNQIIGNVMTVTSSISNIAATGVPGILAVGQSVQSGLASELLQGGATITGLISGTGGPGTYTLSTGGQALDNQGVNSVSITPVTANGAYICATASAFISPCTGVAAASSITLASPYTAFFFQPNGTFPISVETWRFPVSQVYAVTTDYGLVRCFTTGASCTPFGAITTTTDGTPGTYPNVAFTGGSGTGAAGTVVVGAGGGVTSITLASSGGTANIQEGPSTTGKINQPLGAIVGGTGGTPGTYYNVALTGGTGTGAKGIVTVGAGGGVTGVTIAVGTYIANYQTVPAGNARGYGYNPPISGITGLSRTASASAVLLCSTCTAVVGDLITISGASVSTYNGTWPITAVTNNTSITFTTGTNTTDSATGETAAELAVLTASFAGSPSGWSVVVATASTGATSGVNYVVGDSLSASFTGAPSSWSVLVATVVGNNVMTVRSGPRPMAQGDELWTDVFPMGTIVGSITSELSFPQFPAMAQTPTMALDILSTGAHANGSGQAWNLPAGVKRRTAGHTHKDLIQGWVFGLQMTCSAGDGMNCTSSSDDEGAYQVNFIGRLASGDNSSSASFGNLYGKNYQFDVAELGTIGSGYFGDSYNSCEAGTSHYCYVQNCANLNYSTLYSVYTGSQPEQTCAGSAITPFIVPTGAGINPVTQIGPLSEVAAFADASTISSGLIKNCEAFYNNPLGPALRVNCNGNILSFSGNNNISQGYGLWYNPTVGSYDLYGNNSIPTVLERFPSTGTGILGYIGTTADSSEPIYPHGILLGGTAGAFPTPGSERWFREMAAKPVESINIQGNVAFNNAPSLGGAVGWVHTAAGASGATSFGPISLSQTVLQWAGASFVSSGAVPTLSTGSCSGSGAVGGPTAGKFTAASCVAGTYILSALPAAPNGYTCDATDQTTSGDTLLQTANTVSSATLTSTTAVNDVIVFSCLGW